MAHFSDKGKSKGKDYCIFFNSQWARLPQDLNKAVSHDWPHVLFSQSHRTVGISIGCTFASEINKMFFQEASHRMLKPDLLS